MVSFCCIDERSSVFAGACDELGSAVPVNGNKLDKIDWDVWRMEGHLMNEGKDLFS
jgi:hypothetical protein